MPIQNFTVSKQLQTAATTGVGATMSDAQVDQWVVYLRGNGSVTAGQVTIEEDADGTATAWSQVVAPVTLTVGTNAVQAVHLPVGCYGVIRANINTTVTGGTVTATIIGSY